MSLLVFCLQTMFSTRDAFPLLFCSPSASSIVFPNFTEAQNEPCTLIEKAASRLYYYISLSFKI
jgi:hypothetical protein